MTEDAADQKRKADATLARKAWSLAWNKKTPIWATVGVAFVFTLRVWVCEYEDPYPNGLNFEWYGEHCGPGHGTGGEVIDELDEACKRHDEAYKKARE